ncbi:MAG: ABC transporter substrate-binding protein [Solirubrobacteraceae bacterium]
MRRYLFVGVALVVALVVAGCGAGKSAQTASTGGKGSSKPYPELRWGTIAFSGPLDWPRNANGYEIYVQSLVTNGLLEYEADGKVKLGLASSVEHPDATTYVYHLRQVKFSDGKQMTAADVAFSLSRNLLLKESWTKPYWEDVASITTPSRSTVVVKLKQPSAVFEDVVAFSSQVIEKAAAEKLSEKEIGTPGHLVIGAGPWKFDAYQPEAGVQLSRNPYWKGAPQPAQKIAIDLFKTEASMGLAVRSHAIDGAFGYLSPKVFANIPEARMLTTAGINIVLASANTTSPPFNDVHVRRALAYATDTAGMIKAFYPTGTATQDATVLPASIFSGLGSSQQVGEMLGSLPKYEFSLAMARQELAKSAYPHGFSTEIEVEAVASGLVSAAEILAADLAKIGIKAKVRELSGPEAVSVQFSGKTKIVLTEWAAPYFDPEAIMSLFLSPSQVNPPGAGFNTANYKNPKFDRLFSELPKVTGSKRLQMIGQMLKIEGEEAAYWPLYTHLTFSTLSNKYVLPGYSWWTMVLGPWALNVKLAE